VSKPNPEWLRPGALIRIDADPDPNPWYGEIINVTFPRNADGITFLLVRSPRGILANRLAEWVTYDEDMITQAEVIDAIADAKHYIDKLNRNREEVTDMLLKWLGKLK
jgi:hypothetical protein